MESTPPQSSAALSGSEKKRTPPLAPFRSRDFTLLWLGSFVSEAGSQMHVVAVSWQVYQLTHDPLALGGIGVARIVPLVLLALGSGVLADALDRRKLMLFSQLAMMLCSASLALASSLGIVSIWWIYGLTTLASAARTLGMPARQAVIPSLVPREQLPSALSLNIISWQAATIMGPTIGGLLIAGWGVSLIYWFDAISFLAVIAALLVMRLAPIAGERRAVNLRAALEGLAFVRGNTLVWSTMLLDFLATFFSSATLLLPLFVTDVLKVGSEQLGLLYAAPSMGAVVASAVLSVRGPLRRQGPILFWAVAFYGLCTAVFGLSTSFWLSMLMLAGVGASDTVSMVVRGTVRQLTTPDELRGRMVAVNMLFFAGGPQLGEIEAGVAARFMGGPLSVAAGGLACLVTVGILAALTPQLRKYDGI
jgi:MFS family permease